MIQNVIAVERHQDWAVVTIQREHKRNAMDRATREALGASLESLRGTAKAIVLTGTGNSFCSGLDLKERLKDKEDGCDTASQEWIDLNLQIRRHPAIFVAAVNGIALGGGATLIGVSDLAIASTDASIGCPEMGFATYPAMAGPTLQVSLPRKRAAYLILTTNRIDGDTAERWGLVNECVAPERLLTRASQLAEQLSRFDAAALAHSKRALDSIPGKLSDWQHILDFGQEVNQAIRSETQGMIDGLRNFADGRRLPGQG